jgi:membrane protease YdiL (CAAX protease family)
VVLTTLVGAVALAFGVEAARDALPLESFYWAPAGIPLALAIVVLSLLLVASSPIAALGGALRLLRRWRRLPPPEEPFLWTVLVAMSEEAVFRLAAFAVLPHEPLAVIGVSIAFAAIHAPRAARRRRPLRILLASCLLSVVLCVAYLTTESYSLVVVAHIFHNLVLGKLRRALQLGRQLRGSREDGDGAARAGPPPRS